MGVSFLELEAFGKEPLDVPEVRRAVGLPVPAVAPGTGKHEVPDAIDRSPTNALPAHTDEQLHQGIEALIHDGHLPRRPVAPLANMLFGAMCEAAMMVARSENPRRATQDVLAEMRTIQAHFREQGREPDPRDEDRCGRSLHPIVRSSQSNTSAMALESRRS